MPGRNPAKGKSPVYQGDVEEAPSASGIHERTPLKSVESAGSSKEKDAEKVSVFKNPIRWMQALSENYSWRLITMVVVTNHLLKGLVAGGGDEGLVGKPIEFIFGGMGISAGRLQVLKAAAIAPWALKPVVALLSDAVPIAGYKKKPYVIITTVLALFAAIAIGMGFATTIPATVACLFLIFLQISSVDLLVEAKQSEEVKQKAKLGPEFFTFTWLGINIGQVLGVAMLGPAIHHFGPRLPYLIAAPLIALVLWPTLANFLGEKPVPLEERGCNFRLVRRHPVLCSLTLMIGCLIVTLIGATFLLSEGHLISLALLFASLVLAGFAVFIRREIRGPVIFYFLLALLSFSVDGALFYFYTDGPEQYPEGPHFTAYFYTTGMGCAMFVGVMAGFLSGAEIFKDWSYRGILKVTILLRVLTQFGLLPVLLRWTARLGAFEAAYVFLAILLDAMVFAWRWIPKQVMGAHLTPQGMEATMLGLTAGTFNMAMILSSYCGGFLLHQLGTRPAGQPGESYMFQGLWKAQVVAAIAPCTMLFLLPALIPAKRQTEPLITERRDSATYNSVFEVARRT
jgi:MFS family permease